MRLEFPVLKIRTRRLGLEAEVCAEGLLYVYFTSRDLGVDLVRELEDYFRRLCLRHGCAAVTLGGEEDCSEVCCLDGEGETIHVENLFAVTPRDLEYLFRKLKAAVRARLAKSLSRCAGLVRIRLEVTSGDWDLRYSCDREYLTAVLDAQIFLKVSAIRKSAEEIIKLMRQSGIEVLTYKHSDS